MGAAFTPSSKHALTTKCGLKLEVVLIVGIGVPIPLSMGIPGSGHLESQNKQLSQSYCSLYRDIDPGQKLGG